MGLRKSEYATEEEWEAAKFWNDEDEEAEDDELDEIERFFEEME